MKKEIARIYDILLSLVFFILIALVLIGCESGSTSSNTCQTFTDANGNPVTQCDQG